MLRKTPTFIFILILPMLSLFSHAELEQKLLSINSDDKKITLTLFHFNAAGNKASILPVAKNIGSTTERADGIAAISIPKAPGITINDGKIVFGPTADYLLKAGTSSISASNDAFSKHTFVLSNGKGSFVLGYAPLSSKKELTHAILEYVKSNKINYQTAVLLNSGNSSAFYKQNGNYRPYYLKELDSAKQMLLVK